MKGTWRVSGLLAGAVSVALLWAASRIEASVPFPPFSVGERLIRLTPGDVATFFIERLQHDALRLLAAGATLGFLGLTAALPELLAARDRLRPYLAGAIVALISVVASFAAPVEPQLLPVVLASLAAGALYAVSLAWLVEVATLHAAGEVDLSRRRALASIAGVAAGLFVGGSLLGRLVREMAGPNTNVAINAPDELARIPPRPSFPLIPGLSPEVTSVSDHYVVDIDLVDPLVEADGWILSTHGLVDEPMKLTFSELQRRFSLVEEYSVLTCVSNQVGGGLVGSSKWTGVRLRDVLARAGVRDGAVDVVFRCADGYSTSMPLERALDRHTLLAIAQNGRPLTWEHGFPCRVRVPALYGMLNAKWLEEIEVVDFNFEGYWTKRGWSDVGTVRTQSRIDTPREARVGKPTWVAGIAWAGDRRISRVEVSGDGGRTWRPARLRPPISPLAWTQWAYRWTPDRRGTHRFTSRATDGEGRVQDRDERQPHPSGASGYHEVEVAVA